MRSGFRRVLVAIGSISILLGVTAASAVEVNEPEQSGAPPERTLATPVKFSARTEGRSSTPTGATP
jgi:hypothetical protein